MRIQGRGYAFIVAVVASFILKQPELLVTGQATVPAMFVLGDSLVDVGNNNFLASVARANYLPYGIDLNFRPTGRFSNGMNFVDLLGNILDTFSVKNQFNFSITLLLLTLFRKKKNSSVVRNLVASSLCGSNHMGH